MSIWKSLKCTGRWIALQDRIGSFVCLGTAFGTGVVTGVSGDLVLLAKVHLDMGARTVGQAFATLY